MRYYLFVFIFFFVSKIICAQQNYYLTDSSSVFGVEFLERSDKINSRYVKIQTENGFKPLYPSEIKEYGFRNGRVYISKEINLNDSTRTVFLERLVKGNVNLLYYRGDNKKVFYLQKDSSLIEIPEISSKDIDAYYDILYEVSTACPESMKYIEKVRYGKRSLQWIIKNINSCDFSDSPRVSYGFSIGFIRNKLISPNSYDKYLNLFNFHYEDLLSFGGLFEYPISMYGFYLQLEAHYSRLKILESKINSTHYYDFTINSHLIKVPLLIKYNIGKRNIRPFINAGLMVNYNLLNNSDLYISTISNKTLFVERIEDYYFGDLQAGLSVGGGCEYRITRNNSLFFEIRYNRLFGMSDQVSLGLNEYNFLTGLKF